MNDLKPPPSLAGVQLQDLRRRVTSAGNLGFSDELDTSGSLHDEPIVVLLGQPGAGKTAELWRWHQRRPGSAFIELATIDDLSHLRRELQVSDEVFLDGCDETELRPEKWFPVLRQWVNDQPRRRARLSARVSWWGFHSLQEQRLQPCRVVTLQPLEIEDARSLLVATTGSADLLDRAITAGAGALLQNPRLLLTASKVLAATGRISLSRAELYNVLLDELSKEANPQVAQRPPAAASAVRRLAEWFAAAVLLTDRPELTTETLAVGDRRLSADAVAFETREIRSDPGLEPGAVFRSGVMVVRGDDARFVDRSVAESLAARILVERVAPSPLAERRWQRLLTHDVAGERFVPPSLRGMAAACAELSQQALAVVLEADPMVLFEYDFAGFAGPLTAELLDVALNTDQFFEYVRQAPHVALAAFNAHPKGAETVGTLLRGSMNDQLRALQFIYAVDLREFDSALLPVLSDDQTDEGVRFWAAAALRGTLDPDVLNRLAALVAEGNLLDDADHRVLGFVLQAVWPEHLTPRELVEHLCVPTGEGFFEYEHFLASSLVPALDLLGTAEVLRWFSNHHAAHRANFPMDRLGERLVERAADILADSSTDPAGKRELLRCLAATTPWMLEARSRELADGLLSALTGVDAIVLFDELTTCPDTDLAELMMACQWLCSAYPSDVIAHVANQVLVAPTAEDAVDHVHVLRNALNPERDRPTVDRILELTGPDRERFALLLDPIDLASVPQWRRSGREQRPSSKPTVPTVADLGSGSDWAAVALKTARGRADFFTSRPLVEDAKATGLGAVLAGSIRDFIDAWQPMPLSTWDSVTGHQLAYAMAVEAEFDTAGTGWLAERASQLDVAVLALCDTYVRSDSYREALRFVQGACPDDVNEILVRRVNATSSAEVARHLDWLSCYEIPAGSAVALTVWRQACSPETSSGARVTLVREAFRCQLAPVPSPVEALTGLVGQESGEVAAEFLFAGYDWDRLPDPDLVDADAAQVVAAIAAGKEQGRLQPFLDSCTVDRLGLLYSRATALFARAVLPRGGSFLGTEYYVDALRRAILNKLIDHGANGAQELQRLAQSLGSGSLRSIMDRDLLIRFRQAMWTPFESNEVVPFLTDDATAVVSDPAQLLDVLVEAVEAYQRSLHLSGGGAELLWGSDNRPVDEQRLSIDLNRYLRQRLTEGRRVILNREVELKPAIDHSGVRGERSDILVHAEGPSGMITAVLELKGSWNRERVSGYKGQLVDRYLSHADVHCGLHLVFWFSRDEWDRSDPRRNDSPADKSRLELQLLKGRPSCDKPIAHQVIDASITVPR